MERSTRKLLRRFRVHSGGVYIAARRLQGNRVASKNFISWEINEMKMKRYINRPIVLVSGLVAMLATFGTMTATGDDEDPQEMLMYRVTIQNLTMGQPLSPPIVATHEGGLKVFEVGKQASSQLEAIARDGNQVPMFDLLTGSDKVFEVVDVGVPLTPGGTTVGDFTESTTFMIQGPKGAKLSLVSMLVCTNDGFIGLDRFKLPQKGSSVMILHAFDAGLEDNTEMSSDIVDACSGLGPVVLNGDPNGNENVAVDTIPAGTIEAHVGVLGIGDLGPDHQIPPGSAKVTITRVSDFGFKFSTKLGGSGEVPMVLTDASGEAKFELKEPSDDDDDGDDDDGDDDDDKMRGLRQSHVYQKTILLSAAMEDEISFKVKVKNIVGVTQAHIHVGTPDMNGPVVAFLYGPSDPSDRLDGTLAEGVLTEADLNGGPFEGNFAGFLEALGHGDLYVNVHTAEFPGGEIRGQIGVEKAIEFDGDNRPPMAVITSPEGEVSVEPGESVFFAGTATDPDGDPVTVLWDFGDGGSSTELTPGDHTYADAGSFMVTFTATDDQGLSDPTPDMRLVIVGGAANEPPNGVITSPAGDMTIMAGESMMFAGMADDPDGDPVTVLWEFGDGITSTMLSPGDHTYSDPGTFTVIFTATDDKGLSDPTPDTRVITVEAAPPAVTLTTLQTGIFTPTCVRCHGGSNPTVGLDLSSGQAFSNLVNVPASTEPGVRVIPFDADNSVLWTFLDDGHRGRPASELLQIRSWIEAGALDN